MTSRLLSVQERLRERENHIQQIDDSLQDRVKSLQSDHDKQIQELTQRHDDAVKALEERERRVDC